ncbi:MAG TPA: ankyrin repeat domain-containing protein [Bryobacteraceae bacterium]|nr:ankyrin repeat domain-containing protein [Bryobacteraceae bacterium]
MSKELFDAVRAGDQAKVEAMVDSNPALLAATDENGLGPFTVARYSRQNGIADMLLRKGVSLDIFAAAMAGVDQRIIELLAEDRSRITNYSHDGWTPLHLAAFFGNHASAEILLANGADVHAASRNSMQNTPLHAAAAGRQLEVATVLLAHGADVNARQNSGWTPLHSAAQNGDIDMLKLLLGHGADPSSRADNNQTPMDLALTKGQQQAVDILEQHEQPRGAS